MSLAIQTNLLTKKFGNFTAIDNINLAIKQGTIFGFLGPNGSGKSTTIRVLCGILAPTSGNGKILQLYLNSKGEEIKKILGTCPKSSVFMKI